MDLTAQDAATALRDLEAVEETLTARTAGLTNLVWGIAAPLIFLTYGTTAPLVESKGWTWPYAVLWIPGVTLGMLLTAALWHQHAVRLHHEPDGAWRMPAYLVAFFALAGLLWLATDRLLGWDWNTHALMTTVNGLFALVIAGVERRGGVPCAPANTAAGVWMVAAGVALGALGLTETATALLGASAAALGWTGAGIWMLRRG